MQWYRIWAILLRHLLLQPRDAMRIFDITFWPLIDITLWGFVGFWMQKNSSAAASFMFIPIIGALFWQILVRATGDVAVGFLEELWSKNLSNIMSSPLHFSEMIVGLMILSVLRAFVVVCLCSIITWLLYGFNILIFGWWLIPFFILLCISGWMLSFFSIGLIMRWGQRVQAFVWMLSWVFATFSGVFYATDILPPWMQMIGSLLPMTYTFKAMQSYVLQGAIALHDVWISLLLNIVYLCITLLFLHYRFTKARLVGLTQLEVD